MMRKTLMGVVIGLVFLVGILVGIAMQSQPVSAYAAKTIKYLVVPIPQGTQSLQQTLDKYGGSGWELVLTETNYNNHFIFRK